MEDDELMRTLKDLWDATLSVRTDLAAAQTLLRVCLDVLEDDPRFPEALSRVTNLYSARALNSPISDERLVERFMKSLADMTPAKHRHLLNG